MPDRIMHLMMSKVNSSSRKHESTVQLFYLCWISSAVHIHRVGWWTNGPELNVVDIQLKVPSYVLSDELISNATR